MKAAFWRCLMHAYGFSLGLMGLFGLLMPFAFGFRFSHVQFLVFLPLVPLAGLAFLDLGLGVFPIFLGGPLYLGLLALSLWGVRRARSTTIRVLGQIVVLLVFGAAYAAAWYVAGAALDQAAAAAAMSSL
jgi:hypothetical protein